MIMVIDRRNNGFFSAKRHEKHNMNSEKYAREPLVCEKP